MCRRCRRVFGHKRRRRRHTDGRDISSRDHRREKQHRDLVKFVYSFRSHFVFSRLSSFCLSSGKTRHDTTMTASMRPFCNVPNQSQSTLHAFEKKNNNNKLFVGPFTFVIHITESMIIFFFFFCCCLHEYEAGRQAGGRAMMMQCFLFRFFRVVKNNNFSVVVAAASDVSEATSSPSRTAMSVLLLLLLLHTVVALPTLKHLQAPPSTLYCLLRRAIGI